MRVDRWIRTVGAWLAVPTMLCVGAAHAEAQRLGTFTWQLQPYCNRVTVSVIQDGSVYTLDGTDDQCGAPQKAPLVGVAAPNPDGTIGFGLNIVSPTGQPMPVQARISIATLSGTWSDSAGNSGTFAFGAAGGSTPRPGPAAAGDITAVAANRLARRAVAGQAVNGRVQHISTVFKLNQGDTLRIGVFQGFSSSASLVGNQTAANFAVTLLR